MAGSLSGTRVLTYLKAPSTDHRLFLICCEDEGASDQAFLQIAKHLDGTGERERQRLDEDTVKSSDRLADALLSQALLGPSPLFFFRLPNERLSQAIQKGVKAAEDASNGDFNPVVLLAGKLKKSSNLRKFVDGLPSGIVLDLAAPTAQDREKAAREKLAAEGIEISSDGLETFLRELPPNQFMADMEIEKLCLFSRGLDRKVGREDITQLAATSGDAATHELIQAVLRGDTEFATKSLSQLLVSGTQPFAVLRGLDREFTRMLDAHGQLGRGGTPKSVGKQLSPPVFDWAWGRFEAQLKTWPPKRTARALEILSDGEAQLRKSGHLGEALVSRIAVQLSEAVKA